MKVFSEIVKISFKAMIQYKWTFAMTLLSQPILVLINLTLFKSIYAYNETSSIKGYSLDQMVWFFIAGMIVSAFVWNSTVNDISGKILSGELTTDLLKPISLFKYNLADCFASRVIALFMDFIPGMVIYSLIIFPKFLTAFSFAKFLVVVIPAFFINFLCAFVIGLMAMAISNNNSLNAITYLLTAFAGGTLIPMEFYPHWLVTITDFLPFKYIYYWPIQFFLNRSTANGTDILIKTLLFQLLWIGILYVCYKLLWKTMIKKYCAVGG
jgi:ABC-2 type transport system permease protein